MVRTLAVFSVVVGSAIGLADDAAMSFGGSPKILRGHPSVTMLYERVTIHVGRTSTTYDCTFKFKNTGPATSVRIGFPDRGFGANETADSEEIGQAKEKGTIKRPYTMLEHFVSYVDGKRVETKLEGTQELAQSWHTKIVRFGAGESHVIRNKFAVTGSGGICAAGMMLQDVRYIINTGASWKGNIEKAVVDVVFDIPSMKTIHALRATAISDKTAYDSMKWKTLPKNTVAYMGLGKVQAKKNHLIFEKSNFKPTKRDDIIVNYRL